MRLAPCFTLVIFCGFALNGMDDSSLRRVLPLDGRWQIAEGGSDQMPLKFDREVPVPGLADMAEPPFAEPGPKVANRSQITQKDPSRLRAGRADDRYSARFFSVVRRTDRDASQSAEGCPVKASSAVTENGQRLSGSHRQKPAGYVSTARNAERAMAIRCGEWVSITENRRSVQMTPRLRDDRRGVI